MSEKYLISGIMAKMEIYCGNHPEPVKMQLKQGPFSVFYACPKYSEENRNEGEHICANRIGINDVERMVDHINSKMCDNGLLTSSVNLQNHGWKQNGVEYKILIHRSDKICVQCLNRSALTKIKR